MVKNMTNNKMMKSYKKKKFDFDHFLLLNLFIIVF